MTVDSEMLLLPEPELEFGYGQTNPYSKDGLLMFGPPGESGQPLEMRYGLVGTRNGLGLFRTWLKKARGVIPAPDGSAGHHTYWPGFSAVFGSEWPDTPLAEYSLDPHELSRRIRLSDRHHAVFHAVGMIEDLILRHRIEEERQPDVWFVVIPDEVFQYGRPRSKVPLAKREAAGLTLGKKGATRFLRHGADLFDDYEEEAKIYQFDRDFHAQLKARLLGKAVIQVVRESTLSGGEYKDGEDVRIRQMQDSASTAWNLCTTAFFKAQGTPWRLADVRRGVCYIGLVYKIDDRTESHANVCCGAQMFLDSGDGVVFRGTMGPWHVPERGEFHLSFDAAKDIMRTVVGSYKAKTGVAPSEVFIHARTSFDDEEWRGFLQGSESGIEVNGIKIRKTNRLKVYRSGTKPLVRGTAWRINPRMGYLWSTGYIPQLATYPGWEVPKPLEVQVERGDADITTVLQDVLGLTKLNYNACVFGDSQPVTLKFADLVGTVLTATPETDQPPLPFRYYI